MAQASIIIPARNANATLGKAAGKEISVKHIDGPLGVRGRNSQNDRIRDCLHWDYTVSLEEGIKRTYRWIDSQVHWDKRSEEINSMIEDYAKRKGIRMTSINTNDGIH